MTTELRLRRTLAAPPERVWRALTDPAALAAWFWPERLAPTAEVDLEERGRYRVASASAGMAVTGRYVEVTAPRRLVCTWSWDGGDTETLVAIDLARPATGPTWRWSTRASPTRAPARTTCGAGRTAWTGSRGGWPQTGTRTRQAPGRTVTDPGVGNGSPSRRQGMSVTTVATGPRRRGRSPGRRRSLAR